MKVSSTSVCERRLIVAQPIESSCVCTAVASAGTMRLQWAVDCCGVRVAGLVVRCRSKPAGSSRVKASTRVGAPSRLVVMGRGVALQMTLARVSAMIQSRSGACQGLG